MRPFPWLLAAGAGLTLVPIAAGQQYTTVLTHGFTVGSKGAWVQGMAEAILGRAGEGSIFRYDPGTGEWDFVTTLNQPDDVLVLIFNWTDESDAVNEGPNWNFVQAAADALYAALRAPRYSSVAGPSDVLTDRVVHLLGHSRGACVMSEASLRLALAGITVDQVTTMDPHPVNGTLDPPLDLDWGDPVPQKWLGVTWADNYWRADGGGFNAFDFDGIELENAFNVELDESALECNETTICLGSLDFECGYGTAHSDTHLWLHGTIDTSPNPDDGEECISDHMRDTWWDPDGFTMFGYWFSELGGGSADRPARPAGTEPPDVPILYNGSFETASYAGWRYHGGEGPGIVTNDATDEYLELSAAGAVLDTDFTHNRFWLPDGAEILEYDYRILLTSLSDDELGVVLRDVETDTPTELDSITFNSTSGWIRDHAVALPGDLQRDRAYRLTVELSAGAAAGATVDVDNVEILFGASCPWDLDGDGEVGITDFLQLLADWGNPYGIEEFLALLADWGPCP